MLQIAKILKSNGVDGHVLLGVRDIAPGQIDIKEPLFIVFDGLEVPFFIEELVPKGLSKAIVKFDGVDSFQDSEELVGREVFMDAEFEDEDEEDFTGPLCGRDYRNGTDSRQSLCLYRGFACASS